MAQNMAGGLSIFLDSFGSSFVLLSRPGVGHLQIPVRETPKTVCWRRRKVSEGLGVWPKILKSKPGDIVGVSEAVLRGTYAQLRPYAAALVPPSFANPQQIAGLPRS